MSLRQLLTSAKSSHGGWCSLPSPYVAEIMGRADFDWVCVDMQHGLIGYDAMTSMIQALATTGTPALVRVKTNYGPDIMQALDAGAQGVIVPMVETARDAEGAVRACRYPPDGERSWGPLAVRWRSGAYTAEVANQEVVCVAQIETSSALEDLESILDVEGFDVAYVGPADLALSLGLRPTLEPSDAHHIDSILRVLNLCVDRQIVAGIHCPDGATARHWQEHGFRFLTVTSDVRILERGASDSLHEATASAANPNTRLNTG